MRSDRVRRFLRARFGPDVTDLQRIKHGEWSETFSFIFDGAAYVVRFSRLDEDFLKDQVASGYRSPSLPIPCTVELGTAFDDLYYCISERAFGGFVDVLDADGMLRAM